MLANMKETGVINAIKVSAHKIVIFRYRKQSKKPPSCYSSSDIVDIHIVVLKVTNTYFIYGESYVAINSLKKGAPAPLKPVNGIQSKYHITVSYICTNV